MKNVALITGASSGIGKELANIHAFNGQDLIIVARNQERLENLKSELEIKHKVKVMIIVKDLSEAEAPKEIFNEVKQAKIDVQYLINNAGFGGQGKFHERAWERDLAMINLNIVALSALTRLFLPGMVKRNCGRILNVSSTASLMAGPLQAVYFATKAYVTSFSNAIAEELSDTAVTVTALLPGATATEFAKAGDLEKTDLFKYTASASSVAADGYNGMLKGKLNVVSGLTTYQKIMIGLIPVLPKKVALKQVRKLHEINQ